MKGIILGLLACGFMIACARTLPAADLPIDRFVIGTKINGQQRHVLVPKPRHESVWARFVRKSY
jgi:hypothetical protein